LWDGVPMRADAPRATGTVSVVASVHAEPVGVLSDEGVMEEELETRTEVPS
jgi:hypothetical protein